MKVTKKLKKVLCAGLAGCLILGCLTGCGDEEELSDRESKKSDVGAAGASSVFRP